MTDPDRVDLSLRSLSGTPASATWRAPSDVRRRAVRRRRTRWTGTVAVAVVVAVGVTLGVVLPGGSSGTAPVAALKHPSGQHVASRSGIAAQLVSDTRALGATGTGHEAAVAKAEQGFALALLGTLDSSGAAGNVVVSPSSLATALAMLETGAVGKTEKQIATTLHTGGLSAKAQDAGWAALSADLVTAATKSGVSEQSANSLWLQQNLPMAPAFMKVMARYFRTGVWQVDFHGHLSQAQRALNAWVAKQTHGKITSLFNPGDITPDTVLVLANAVYFKAAWKYRFSAGATKPGTFTEADGHTSTVPFMSYGKAKKYPSLASATASSYDAVQLPYSGGRFAALAIMPKKASLAQFVRGLDAGRLASIVSSLSTAQLDVRIPKFTLRKYTKLNGTLAAMGMPTAFTPSADFSAMSPQGLSVQTIAQRAYLKVDEKGTEAAAATGIGVVPTLGRITQRMTFDHPFLFLVRDTRTGAILFAAQVTDPTA
jgi:serpin B